MTFLERKKRGLAIESGCQFSSCLICNHRQANKEEDSGQKAENCDSYFTKNLQLWDNFWWHKDYTTT
jgi:hypothetical protein